MRPTRPWSWLAAAALLSLAVPAVRAEDEEPAAPTGKTKPETIFKDWKDKVKKGNRTLARERATYWEGQGVKGKDLLWLGFMWKHAQDYAKAAAAMEGSLVAPDITDKNKEVARFTLIDVYGLLGDWPKVIATTEKFRSEFATSSNRLPTVIEEGRARRMAGEDSMAVALFTQAADENDLDGILELVDLHMAAGDKAAAEAVLAKYAEADIKGKDQYFGYYRDFLSVVGTPAPSIADAKSITKVAGPSSFEGKPTLLYYWHMQITNPEYRLGRANRLANAYGDRVQVAAVSTYEKYNPETSKKDPSMTEEQELGLYRQFAETIVGNSMPAGVVVPVATKEALKIRFELTKLVIDKDGKFRYVRPFEIAKYGWDWLATELAVKKLLGTS
jgi:hypothetical protein